MEIFAALAAFIIACEDMRDRGQRSIWSYRLALLFAGLTGICTSLLLPMFAVRAYFERSRESVVQLSIVAGAATLQIVCHLLFLSNNSGLLSTPSSSAQHIFALAFFDHILVPIFGPKAFTIASLASLPTHGSGALHFAARSWLSALFFFIVLAALCGRRVRSMQWIMTVGFLSTSIGTVYIFANGASQARAAVLPGFLFLSILVTNLFSTQRAGIIRWCSAVLLVVAIVIGSWNFRKRGEFNCFGGCPDWRQEVARWKKDSSYAPAVWPNTDWRVYLPPPAN